MGNARLAFVKVNLFAVLVTAVLSGTAEAQVTYRQLKTLAADALQRGSVSILSPDAYTYDGGTKFEYDLGGVSWHYVKREVASRYKPFLDAQLHVEVIRRYLPKQKLQVFTQGQVEQAEQRIANALASFMSARSDEARLTARTLLLDYKDAFKQAGRDYAARSGLQIVESAKQKGGAHLPPPTSTPVMLVALVTQFNDELSIRTAERELAAFRVAESEDIRKTAVDNLWELFGRLNAEAMRSETLALEHGAFQGKGGITVQTSPEGADVSLMPVLEQQLAKMEGRNPVWEAVSDGDFVDLKGDYYYTVQWPDGSNSGGRRRTRVDRGDELVLPHKGLLISKVYQDTAATKLMSRAGETFLEAGDRLVAIDGNLVTDSGNFSQMVRAMPRNAAFIITIINSRGGEELDLNGRLDQGGGYRLGIYVKDP